MKTHIEVSTISSDIDEKHDKKKLWKGYAALFLAILFFSGATPALSPHLACLDFSTVLGAFGNIAEKTNFLGKGGNGALQGFLFALSLIPCIMLSLGIVAVAEYHNALYAAQKLLTPLLRPLLGIPGCAGLALISSLQSSDAGAAMTRGLHEKGLLNDGERDLFCAFQFPSAASILCYLTVGAALLPLLAVPMLLPLGLILICKVLGCNILRLFLHKNHRIIADEASKTTEDKNDVTLEGSKIESSGIGTRIISKTIPEHSEEKGSFGKGFLGSYEILLEGMRKGWKLSTQNMLPNIVLAFAFIAFLRSCGLLSAIGSVLAPAMSFFGLPGEASAVLLSAWFSAGGGVGVALSLYAEHILSPEQLSILMPAIFLMGAQIQMQGRVLSMAGANQKLYGKFMLLGILEALFAMLAMRHIFL